MDPLTGASAFATIVGLVCNFKSQRSSAGVDEYQDFISSLNQEKYSEIIAELQTNNALSSGIKSLLDDNHDEVMSKLKALEASMIAVSSHISGLKEISESLIGSSSISDQAFSILKQLNHSGGSFFLEVKMMGGTIYQVMDADGTIEMNEPRFVEDDLSKLCESGLLLLDYNSKGERLFRFTRSAASLLDASDL